jgi:tetratricopeptide (TPR) repeat protein
VRSPRERPLDKSMTARRKAQQLARDGMVDRAIDEMEQVLQCGETDPYDYVFQGDLMVRAGRTDDGVAAYDEAVSAYEKVGLYRNAIAISKKILRTSPGRVRTHWRLGDLFAKEGLMGDSVSHFLTFLDQGGGEASGEEFLETLERVAQVSGAKVEVTLRLAELYGRAGHDDRAARLLNQVADQAAAQGGFDIAQMLRERAAQVCPADLDGSGVFRDESPTADTGADEAVDPFNSAYQLVPESVNPSTMETARSPGAPVALEPNDPLALEPNEPLTIETDADGCGGEDPADAEPVSPASSILDAPFIANTGGESEDVPTFVLTPIPDDPGAPDDPRVPEVRQALISGEWGTARALCEEMLESHPESVWPLEKLIAAVHQLGDTLATVRYLTLLGDLRINREDLEGALGCFLRVIEIEPENVTARRRLARFHEMGVPGAEQVPEAVHNSVQELIETKGATVAIRDQGGVESEEWIDLTALLQEFREGVRAQFGPEDAVGHYDLGLSHQEMGLYEEAIEEFDCVLACASADGDLTAKTRELRGLCLERLERMREAIFEYRAALEIPDSTDSRRIPVLYRLATALETVGDREEALQIFRQLSTAEEPFLDSAERCERLEERAA